jgi:hypothetical protein
MAPTEKELMAKMREGIVMAIEAAHELGGRLNISYTSSQNLQSTTVRLEPHLARAKMDVKVFRSLLGGMTYTQVALQCKIRTCHVAQHWERVWAFLRNELLSNPNYKNSPLKIQESGSRQFEFDETLQALRRHKEYLLAMVDNFGDEEVVRLLAQHEFGLR